MSALTVGHDPGQGWDDVVRLWEGTDWPEGCKVEIIEGIVTVYHRRPMPTTTSPTVFSGACTGLSRRLGDLSDAGSGSALPQQSVHPRPRRGAEGLLHEGSGSYISAAAAELVVEITSKANAVHDRVTKAAGYASAGVPLYLLIDRWAPAGPKTTLYGEPKGDVYRVLETVKFGEVIGLPAPFGLGLDTGAFPVD